MGFGYLFASHPLLCDAFAILAGPSPGQAGAAGKVDPLVALRGE